MVLRYHSTVFSSPKAGEASSFLSVRSEHVCWKFDDCSWVGWLLSPLLFLLVYVCLCLGHLVLLLGVCSVCSLISGTVISASVLFMPTIIYYQGLLQRFYANCRIPHTHTSSVKIARRIVLLIASKF